MWFAFLGTRPALDSVVCGSVVAYVLLLGTRMIEYYVLHSGVSVIVCEGSIPTRSIVIFAGADEGVG